MGMLSSVVAGTDSRMCLAVPRQDWSAVFSSCRGRCTCQSIPWPQSPYVVGPKIGQI